MVRSNLDTTCRREPRAMLRRIVGTGRADTEDYLSWIIRTTRKAEALALAGGVRDWVQAHCRAKWLWAGHVARRPTVMWVWRVTTWRDSEWQALVSESGLDRPLRPSRRRWMKWEDPLRRFCAQESSGSWPSAASVRDAWAERATSFVQWYTAQQ